MEQAISAARDKRRAVTPPEGADIELNEALTKGPLLVTHGLPFSHPSHLLFGSLSFYHHLF